MRETKFKLCDAGVIPSDWEQISLADIFDFGNGYTPSTDNKLFWRNGNIPWFRVEDIRENGHVLDDSIQHVTPLAVKGGLFPKNSFIISTSATIGEYAYITSPFLANQRFVCLLKKGKECCAIDDSYFLCLCENLGQWCKDNCDQGSSFASVNMPLFRSHQVPLPPISEQRKIAHTIRDIDGLIDSLSKLIEKKNNIKKGAMQELLTGKKRLNGSSEAWQIKKLGEILSIGNGRDYKHLQKGAVPVYGTGGLMTYVSDFLYDGETVCIGRKGTIDEPQYHNGKIWTVDTLFYTHSFINVNVKFLYYLFTQIDWHRYNEATGVPSLTASKILNIDVLLPSEGEQSLIANILTDMDNDIFALEAKKSKYESIRKGIMQELLTGHIRLV